MCNHLNSIWAFGADNEKFAVPIACNKPTWKSVYDGYLEHPHSIAFANTDPSMKASASARCVAAAILSGTQKCFGSMVIAKPNFGIIESYQDVEELQGWLSSVSVWRRANVNGKPYNKNGGKEMYGWRGVIIVERNNGLKYAALWDRYEVVDAEIMIGSRIMADDTVYFWQLEKSNPRVFSEKEFNTYMWYIKDNAAKENDRVDDRYGPGPNDWHDCINTVVWGMRRLLNVDASTLPIKEHVNDQMDLQMDAMRGRRYADDLKEFDFNYNTKPVSFNDMDGPLSEIVLSRLCSDVGYYFFGLSIMDGHHSAIIVVNNIDPGNPKFNIYDQYGSFVYWVLNKFGYLVFKQPWYSSEEINKCLLRYVQNGNPLYYQNGEPKKYPGKTITRVTRIKHKWED